MPGLLSRLFGKAQPAPASRTVEAIIYGGDDTLEVVGEAYRQDTLWQIVGGRTREPVRFRIDAILMPEPENEFDSNAVSVLVNGRLVGHLEREDAAAYLPGILRLMDSSGGAYVALHGQIIGGGERGDGIGFLGVFLDHEPTDFGLTASRLSGGMLRTGLSAARATDEEDDSYDLSWIGTLGEDDSLACARVEALLLAERDPIDRHYMFCELATRRYRLRDQEADALAMFDAVCERHEAEMGVLRPALVAKFGVAPVVLMYRQAVIREQKAKAWERSRQWALRGIAFYGGQAARPEVVDDLRKRLAHAEAKLAAPSQPKPPRASSQVAMTVAAPQIETLTCEGCGRLFERVRSRGRKPKHCPECRGLTVSAAD